MNLYFISGLGADERVFKRLSFPGQYQIHHIKWPEISPKETLQSFCQKIAMRIDTSKPFGLIGLSFGGIIATELTKMINPTTTIIISSIATRKQLPFHYKICRSLSLHKWVPSFTMNKLYPFTNWYFGVTEPEDKHLLKQLIKDTSPQFLKWAINEILHWQNETIPHHLYHIHGTADRLFPFKKTRAGIAVENGGHLMVYTQADFINRLILGCLGAAGNAGQK